MNVEDIFSMFDDIFGGIGRRPRPCASGGVPRGYDLETEVEITLEEVLAGAERDVEFKRLDVCQTLHGQRSASGYDARALRDVRRAGPGGADRASAACSAW